MIGTHGARKLLPIDMARAAYQREALQGLATQAGYGELSGFEPHRDGDLVDCVIASTMNGDKAEHKLAFFFTRRGLQMAPVQELDGGGDGAEQGDQGSEAALMEADASAAPEPTQPEVDPATLDPEAFREWLRGQESDEAFAEHAARIKEEAREEAEVERQSKITDHQKTERADKERLQRLTAALEPLMPAAYELRRNQIADEFGVRVAFLDKFFEQVRDSADRARKQARQNGSQGEESSTLHIELDEDPGEAIARRIEQYACEVTDSLPDRHCTDLGNAERVADRFHKVVKWIPQLGCFAYDDGKRFVQDEIEITLNLVKLTMRDIVLEGRRSNDADKRKEILEWAIKSEDRKRIMAAYELLKSDPRIVTPLSSFDTDPWEIYVENGVYHARRDEFRSRLRGELNLHVASASYDSDATAPQWAETLKLMSNGRQDWIDRMQAFLGYGFTGDNSAQVFAEGTGRADRNTRNLKSTLVKIGRGIMGSYARNVSPSVFLYDKHRREDGPRPELAQLPGVRMVFATETPQYGRLDAPLLKKLFGGDAIQVRQLYQQPFEYEPVFKLFFASNHKLRIGQFDDAIARRIMYFPFDFQVPEDRVVLHFAEKLLAEERSGILGWFLVGAGMWASTRSFPESQAVDYATSDYIKHEDIVCRFVDEMCIQTPEAKAYTEALYTTFHTWAEQNGELELSRKTFTDRLEALGFKKGLHDRGGTPWAGLGILEIEP